MRYLLDTHTFIWFTENNPSLGKTAGRLVKDSNNEIFISIASLWEIAIKTSLRKLSIIAPFDSVFDDLAKLDIQLIPIKFEHTAFVNKLPHYHKDPFDRMIVSQAMCENLDLLSCDDKFDKYLSASLQKRFW